MSAFISFLVVEMFFALEMVARELENVFGTDANDLDLQEFQEDFNLQLESLFSPDVQNQFKMLCSLPENWDIDDPTVFVKEKPGWGPFSGLQIGAVSKPGDLSQNFY